MNGQPAAAARFCRSRTLKGVWMGWMTSRARVSSWSNHMLPGQAGLMTNLVAPSSMYSCTRARTSSGVPIAEIAESGTSGLPWR